MKTNDIPRLGLPAHAWLLATVLAVLVLSLPASAYTVVSEETEEINVPFGKLLLTETVVQDGPLPINRFRMYRLRRAVLHSKGTLLLLPSLGNNFQMYLFDESGDRTKSFAAFYARLGYEVWGYSPRETGIQPGDCGGVLDCTPALQWSLQTVVDDVTYIRTQIGAVLPGKKTVIGGLSLGAISSLAVVNQHPFDYDGLLAWEGSYVSDNPAVQAHNLGFCNQFTGLVGAGIAVDDQSLPFVKLVAQLEMAAPDDPFAIPVPGFPPGLTNHQAFVFILSTPNPIAPSPRPGFITAAGNFSTDTLFFSDDARLGANIGQFNDVTANRVGQDLYCSLAGVQTAYSANLANFTAPAMIIKAGQGFGQIMDELAGKLGSTSVTQTGIEFFAHVDHLGTAGHRFVLEIPVSLWLSQVIQ
jgi:pimeloyl-ACP methyl ester carboxylesterase